MHSFLSQVFIITLIIAQICSRLLPDKVVFSDIWILCTHGFYFRIHSTNSILKKVLFDRPYSLASIWPSISYLEECHFPCEYPDGQLRISARTYAEMEMGHFFKPELP